MTFNLDGYVDVAERIRIFREKHPDGSLQSDIKLFHKDDVLVGVLCRAEAFRKPDDSRPGVGHSYLRIPGKTPYTEDSEVENAETSAWGRAIVAALAADTKKIASTQEVRKASGAGGNGHQGDPGSADVAAAHETNRVALESAGGEFRFLTGKHAGKTLSEVPDAYLVWYLENGPKQDVKEAIRVYRDMVGADIPFGER